MKLIYSSNGYFYHQNLTTMIIIVSQICELCYTFKSPNELFWYIVHSKNHLWVVFYLGTTTSVNEAGLQNEMGQMDCQITGNSTLTKTSWAKVYVTKYMPGSVIVFNFHHGFPVFGEIKQVFVADGHKVCFEYSKINVVEFVSHLNAYSVEKCHHGVGGYVKKVDLFDCYPLGLVKGYGCYRNKLFIVLKYHLDCML